MATESNDKKSEYDVFISYSHKDKDIADSLVVGLEAAGIRCWIAPRNIRPGESWGGAIIRHIRETNVFILVLTHHSNHSDQVLNEVERASGHGKSVICILAEPVVLADDLEYFLSSKQWVDVTNKSYTEKIHNSVAAIKKILPPLANSPIEERKPTKPPTIRKKQTISEDAKKEESPLSSASWIKPLFIMAILGWLVWYITTHGNDSASLVSQSTESDSSVVQAPLEETAVQDTSAFNSALEFLRMGDYNSAFTIFYELALKGDANAQNNLGIMYKSGLGVKQDLEQATNWLQKAARQGSTPAQDTLRALGRTW